MINKRLRFAVLERDGFKCRYCGRGKDEVKLEVDHVIPKALGGQDIIANLATACQDCNRGKGSSPLSPQETRAMMKALRPLKREQMAESIDHFTISTATVTKYVRDIDGAMGRGRSIEEAVAFFSHKHPEYAAEYRAAGFKVLEKRANSGCRNQGHGIGNAS